MLNIDPDDQKWLDNTLKSLPIQIRKLLMKNYIKKDSRKAANLYILGSINFIEKHLPNGFSGINLNWTENDFRIKAGKLSQYCLRILHNEKSLPVFMKKKLLPISHPSDDPVLNPLLENRNDFELDSSQFLQNRYDSISRFASELGVKPPKVKNIKGENGSSKKQPNYMAAINRLCNERWWLKALRKAHSLKVETAMHAMNLVNSKTGMYASDLSVSKRKAQNLRNKRELEKLLAVNEVGDSFTLAELSEKNVSNPEIRRAELMTRIRGIEDYADKIGLKSLFITVTCPSKYHRSHSQSGKPNSRWGGFTPLHGQEYLNHNWERVRTAFQRDGINPIGIRVVEPQHDGTPHWHMLFFIAPERVDDAVNICRRYALEEDGNEAGADKHRIDVTKIDPQIGSATGYIAKYICKNIDGSNLDSGIYGEDPVEGAQRVDTWSSVWGIRQFQFIGGSSVTVWRELRRLSQDSSLPDEFEEIRKAADESNWCLFNLLMGGFFCKRKEQKVRPYYSFKANTETGEVTMSLYGDRFVECLLGVFYDGQHIITRIHEWKIEKIGRNEMSPLGVL